MLGMVAMAALISLSDILYPPVENLEGDSIIAEEPSIPIVLAVLSSLVIPTMFALGTLLIKYVD